MRGTGEGVLAAESHIGEQRGQLGSRIQYGRSEGGHQARGHERGDAAGRDRLCEPGPGEVQHREGHRRLHQEGVRQEVQPHLALRRRPQLRLLRHPRDQALHLLLHGAGRHPALQVRMNYPYHVCPVCPVCPPTFRPQLTRNPRSRSHSSTAPVPSYSSSPCTSPSWAIITSSRFSPRNAFPSTDSVSRYHPECTRISLLRRSSLLPDSQQREWYRLLVGNGSATSSCFGCAVGRGLGLTVRGRSHSTGYSLSPLRRWPRYWVQKRVGAWWEGGMLGTGWWGSWPVPQKQMGGWSRSRMVLTKSQACSLRSQKGCIGQQSQYEIDDEGRPPGGVDLQLRGQPGLPQGQAALARDQDHLQRAELARARRADAALREGHPRERAHDEDQRRQEDAGQRAAAHRGGDETALQLPEGREQPHPAADHRAQGREDRPAAAAARPAAPHYRARNAGGGRGAGLNHHHPPSFWPLPSTLFAVTNVPRSSPCRYLCVGGRNRALAISRRFTGPGTPSSCSLQQALPLSFISATPSARSMHPFTFDQKPFLVSFSTVNLSDCCCSRLRRNQTARKSWSSRSKLATRSTLPPEVQQMASSQRQYSGMCSATTRQLNRGTRSQKSTHSVCPPRCWSCSLTRLSPSIVTSLASPTTTHSVREQARTRKRKQTELRMLAILAVLMASLQTLQPSIPARQSPSSQALTSWNADSSTRGQASLLRCSALYLTECCTQPLCLSYSQTEQTPVPFAKGWSNSFTMSLKLRLPTNFKASSRDGFSTGLSFSLSGSKLLPSTKYDSNSWWLARQLRNRGGGSLLSPMKQSYSPGFRHQFALILSCKTRLPISRALSPVSHPLLAWSLCCLYSSRARIIY